MPAQADFCAHCGTAIQQEPTNPELQPGDTGIAEAPGKNFLLIAGISYIFLSTISLIGIMRIWSLVEWWLPSFGGESLRSSWQAYYTILSLYACFILCIGIMGVVHRANLRRAKLLYWLAISEIGVYCFANLILFSSLAVVRFSPGWTHWLTPLYSGFGFPTVLFLPIDIALFIVFVIGARKNIEKSKKE